MDFQKGKFQKFRATRAFALGSVEGMRIEKDQVVQFDGVTLKVGGDAHTLPALKGAVNNGMLVLASTPMNAPVQVQPVAARQIRPAIQTRANENVRISMGTTQAELQDTGSISQIRGRDVKVAAPFRHEVEQGYNPGEGREIARIKTPAIAKPTEINNSNVMSIKQRAERGNLIERAEPTVAPDPRIRAARQNQVLSEDRWDERAARREEAIEAARKVDPAAARKMEKQFKESDRQEKLRLKRQATQEEEEPLETLPLEEEDALNEENPSEEEEDSNEDDEIPDDIVERIRAVQAYLPKFTWDLDRPAEERAQDALTRYRKNKMYLKAILQIESATVVEMIEDGLA